MGSTTRLLGTADRTALVEFRCYQPGNPWSVDAQECVAAELPDLIRQRRLRGLGLWLSDDLVGVAAFKFRPGVGTGHDCFCEMLAINNEWLGRGYGLALKAALLEHAWGSHAVAVTSHVERENLAMLSVNRRLNATILPHPNDSEVMLCVIPVAPPLQRNMVGRRWPTL